MEKGRGQAGSDVQGTIYPIKQGNRRGGAVVQLTARVKSGLATGSSIARSSKVSNVKNSKIFQSQEAELKKHAEQSPASSRHMDAGRVNAHTGSGRIMDRKYIISLCRSNTSCLGCRGCCLFSRVAPATVGQARHCFRN